MMANLAIAGFMTGTALASRPLCLGSRAVGGSLIGLCAILLATPAYADQTLMVSDNSRVDCTASARDLTRISLIGDEIASISKVDNGNPGYDFSVVNEPLRGDIYLSVPDGFASKALSFFATSKKGYVYKFVCKIEGNEAQQVFLANPAIAAVKTSDTQSAASPSDQAVQLVQAMYASEVPDGFQMRQPVLNTVYVGALKVQMIAEYRGSDLIGKVLRIANRSRKPVTLLESEIAPEHAVAVTISEPKLEAGQVTTAYLVMPQGN